LPTIAEAISEGAARLRDSSVDEERRTAGLLLGHALGVGRAELLIRSNEQTGESQYETYLHLIERRASGEPLQYITGRQEFYGLDFIVTPEVLIPRPETEFLVEQVIKLARIEALDEAAQQGAGRAPLIVDLGTGSGCVAVAVAAHIHNARVLAVDISGAALGVARRNAERHGVAGRIELIEGDLLDPLAGRGLDQSVDIIASNPPYVEEGRPELVQREVREWEPAVALFGGPDGLDFYRRLIAGAPKYLRPGGHMVMEIGYTQLEPIREIISSSGLDLIDVTGDLRGIPRTLTLRKPS
jgi:release factor glutamine methyltransferase